MDKFGTKGSRLGLDNDREEYTNCDFRTLLSGVSYYDKYSMPLRLELWTFYRCLQGKFWIKGIYQDSDNDREEYTNYDFRILLFYVSSCDSRSTVRRSGSFFTDPQLKLNKYFDQSSLSRVILIMTSTPFVYAIISVVLLTGNLGCKV
jgi:hypothetical protein